MAEVADLEREASGEVERFGAASSVATVKRAWGWDESPSIRVTIDDDASTFESIRSSTVTRG